MAKLLDVGRMALVFRSSQEISFFAVGGTWVSLMKISIRGKLLLAFAVILSLMSIVWALSYFAQTHLASEVGRMYTHPLAVTRSSLKANSYIMAMHRSMKDVVLASNDDELNNAIAIVDDLESKVLHELAFAKKRILGDEGKKLASDTYRAFKDWRVIRDEVISLVQVGKIVEAITITKGKGADHVRYLNTKAEQLWRYAENKGKAFNLEAQAYVESSSNRNILIFLTVILFSSLLALYISFSISSGLKKLKAATKRIARGDLNQSVQIKGGDEIADLGAEFNLMAAQLSDTYSSLEQQITDRKKAEEELVAKSNDLSEAQRLAKVGNWILYPESGIVEGSDELHRIFDLNSVELTLDEFTGVVHPEDLKYDMEMIQRGIEKGEPWNIEHRLHLKDGTVKWIEAIGQPVVDETGKTTRILGTVQDITERKLAEEEITRNAGLLRSIAKTQSSFIVDSPPHKIFDSFLSDILELTGSAYGFVGEVHTDDKGEKFLKVFAWTNIAWDEETRALYEKYKKGGVEFHNLKSLYGAMITTGELVIANDPANDPRAGGIPGGHPALNAFIGLPVKREGELIGMVGLANRDGGYDEALAKYLEPLIETCSGIITSINNEKLRKESEVKLKLSAMVFENAMEGVVVTDADGIIQFVNQAFTEITGFEEKEAIGQTPRLIQSDRHDKEFYDKMWSDLQKYGRWQGEVWNRHKNGEPYLIRQNIAQMKDSAGKATKYVSVFHDITEAKRDEEEIKYQAYHDLLTGLANRALFNDRLTQAIGRANRDKQKVALLFIDVDDFKSVNDNFGHHAGDLLLQGIAIRLTACMRDTDTVSRYSGDEFVIIMENIRDDQTVASVAQKIIESLSEPYIHKGKKILSTVSIGIAIYPADGESGDMIVKNADLAMYQVKAKSKDNFSFFTKSLNDKAIKRHELEYKMREALERIEFVVYYQPKVSLATGKITGAEALVRWKSDDKIIPPSAFIPLAEETGLIVPISEFVLFSACEQLKAWQNMGHKDLTVSVNISARQLDNGDLVNVVLDTLAKTGLDADSLCLEVTETATMRDMDTALVTLHKIKKMGVHISLDDFGTGYSSLSHLRTLPIDELKIDRFFIISIPDNKEDSAIATTIISMAQSLKLSVIAEGVETKAQLDFLRSAGCNEIQGYLFSRPVPAEEMEKLLKAGKTFSFV